MTTSKMIRLGELLAAVAVAFGLAFYRADLAGGGQPLIYGGIQYPHMLLALLLGLAVAAFFALSFFVFKVQRPAPGVPCTPYKVGANLAGLGMLAAAALYYIEKMPSPGLVTYIQVAFLSLCGITLLMGILRGGDSPMAALFSLFPVYYMCLFLLMFYRENSKNPVVLSFGFEILTVVSVTAAVYALSGRSFGQYRPRQHLFFSLTAVLMVSFELFSALLRAQLVLSVPGVSPAWLVQMGAMALYVAAGVFLPLPATAQKAPTPAPGADDDTPGSDQWSFEEIKAQLEEEETPD